MSGYATFQVSDELLRKALDLPSTAMIVKVVADGPNTFAMTVADTQLPPGLHYVTPVITHTATTFDYRLEPLTDAREAPDAS